MIPDAVKKNFETMARAFRHGDVALMECTRTGTEFPAVLVCAVQKKKREDGKMDVTMIPFAEMILGNPYQMFEPPKEEETAPPAGGSADVESPKHDKPPCAE